MTVLDMNQCLIQIGQLLSLNSSENNILGRLGGNEFLVESLSPEDEMDQCERLHNVKDRLQQHIRGDYYLGISLCIIRVPIWVLWKSIHGRLTTTVHAYHR